MTRAYLGRYAATSPSLSDAKLHCDRIALTKYREHFLRSMHTFILLTHPAVSTFRNAGYNSQRWYSSALRDIWLSRCRSLDLGELPAIERVPPPGLTLVASCTASRVQAQSSSAMLPHSQKLIMSSFPICAATATPVNQKPVITWHA